MYSAGNTHFASPDRSTKQEIEKSFNQIMEMPFFRELMDNLSETVVILDENRQIVFANKQLLRLLGFETHNLILGMRPGEALECRNAVDDKDNPCCGTTERCKECGAVKAILTAQTGAYGNEECRILTEKGTAMDLLITTKPLNVNDRYYTFFTATDISDKKRKAVLERMFFHDAINLAGVVLGMSELLKDDEEIKDGELVSIIYDSANALVDEINSYKLLTRAENNDLDLNISELNSFDVIRELASFYSKHKVCFNKRLNLDLSSEQIILESDKTILRRILGNMIKNALEASLEGEDVSICSSLGEDGKSVIFSVHNKGVIPKKAQTQIFQRSFTTKGNGRGVGTYSMKLLTEKYLKGRVSFTSGEDNGTTFYAEFPIQNTCTLQKRS
ncbi:sensor histidine kinase [Limisalsivibrio acetivorans]|uniref:sensor histidine kinase n=1 Tax=Limisalsivibrio acetivorans TaxID=1304888 RepID=UPI0003B3C77A|nr:sensor histidine kinase [Limisalsivibrio acetivorans]